MNEIILAFVAGSLTAFIISLYLWQSEWNERHKETSIETVDGKFFPATQEGLQEAINHASELDKENH